MIKSVGVLYEDEFATADPELQTALEQMPAVQMILENELASKKLRNTVALIFVQESEIASALVRIAALKKQLPSLRIVVGVQVMSADNLRQLMEAGADCFVTQRPSSSDLCSALTPLLPDESRFASAAAEEPELDLTPRETEILRYLSSGFSNKEVARRLDLSVRTVETHRLNLRRKTQTGRLKDLVTLARTLGLAPMLDGKQPSIRHFAPRASLLASEDYSAPAYAQR